MTREAHRIAEGRKIMIANKYMKNAPAVSFVFIGHSADELEQRQLSTLLVMLRLTAVRPAGNFWKLLQLLG